MASLLLCSSCHYTLNPCADSGRFGKALCVPTPFSVSQTQVTVGKNLTQSFTVAGGTPPYSYAVTSGVGSFVGATYISGITGTGVVQIQDAAGNSATVNVSVVGTWTWVGGSSSLGVGETYETQGVAAAGNTPGGRTGAYTWYVPASGVFWLYGGIDTAGNQMQDLWSWDGSNWTWVGGTQLTTAAGTWSALSVAATTNLPGSRNGGMSWVDSSGNLWLFGGSGFDATSVAGEMADMWEYIPSAGTWAWVSGSNTANDFVGSYGANGVAATTNYPMSREHSPAVWVDTGGTFWLFGGYNTNGPSYLSDLWNFDPVTLNWTLWAGTNAVNVNGVYGALGVASLGYLPGSRYASSGFADISGNLWLFGGFGLDSVSPTDAVLNDLWEFNIFGDTWAWMAGSNLSGGTATYGTQLAGSSSNTPPALQSTKFWADSSGNGWMFGGNDAGGNAYNDLWKWNGTQWTWIAGPGLPNTAGSSGVSGVAAVSNLPSARAGFANWIDSSGNFHLFGGGDSIGNLSADFWVYSP